jgi:hypothetical protein
MKHRGLVLVATLFCTLFVFAQRSQPSPGVGNAVLLATNSIQIERDTVIVSGDLIVNNPRNGAVLGAASLSIDRSTTTPAGYRLAAGSISLDRDVVVRGDVYYNTLTNDGTISGTRFTPLALPVYAALPPAVARPAGTSNVVLADNALLTLDEGAYGNLTVGRGAKLRLSGGGYAFRSITVSRDAEIRYAAPVDVIVSGRAEFGLGDLIAPADGSGVSPAACRIQVNGINGSNGALTATPPAVHFDRNGTVLATVYATAGSIVIDRDFVGTGAFFGRDVAVARNSRLTINSAFNAAPIANALVVSTNGTSPLPITLTGSDPEGGALTFSIVSGPAAGTLSAPVSASANSANVTYTPSSANVADSFIFRVRDAGGATGDGVVTINATESDPPVNATTVLGTDSSAPATQDVAATLLLRGSAPTGVAITFSIVSGSGPSHGSLSAVTQGSEVPERSATVVYTPAPGYVGPDAFQFQACGVIASVNVCDAALFSITVLTPPADAPSIAHDVAVTTSPDAAVLISLGESSITTASRRVVPLAATLVPVTIAGNVADANVDGFGDNANALPGATPVFMSAGLSQSGGAGSNGTVRMQFEWDITNVSGSIASLSSADVLLPTHRGTIDSLDTFFYAVGATGDGQLTSSDFESPAQQIAAVVMPVPSGMSVGADGTFTFSVLSQLRAAAQGGFGFFAIQGRVNESPTGTGRGLEVRTSASGNISSNMIPTLALMTPTITPLQFRITSLPAGGVLRDASNQLIMSVPYDLASAQVSYTPNSGFLGNDSFSFAVSNGVVSNAAVARINVSVPNCAKNQEACFNGR